MLSQIILDTALFFDKLTLTSVDTKTVSAIHLRNRQKQAQVPENDLNKFSIKELSFTIVLLLVTLQTYTQYLEWNETRPDIKYAAMLDDPVLAQLEGGDYSIHLFMLVYGSILGLFVYAWDKPGLILEFLQTKSIVIWVRMVALYLTPLEAPANTVPLVDPLAQAGGNPPLVRDLFFSGHTATTCLVFFVCRSNSRWWKFAFGAIALVTGFLVICQKTHYAIDVYSAPFFVYTCSSAIQSIRKYAGTF